jgi:hypothetical protein
MSAGRNAEAGTTRFPVVDVHAHAVLELSLGAAGPEAGELPDGTPFYRVGDYVLRGVRYAGTPGEAGLRPVHFIFGTRRYIGPGFKCETTRAARRLTIEATVQL